MHGTCIKILQYQISSKYFSNIMQTHGRNDIIFYCSIHPQCIDSVIKRTTTTGSIAYLSERVLRSSEHLVSKFRPRPNCHKIFLKFLKLVTAYLKTVCDPFVPHIFSLSIITVYLRYCLKVMRVYK